MLAALAICLILLVASFVWISPIVVKVLERGLTEKLLEARELLLKAQALEAQRRAEGEQTPICGEQFFDSMTDQPVTCIRTPGHPGSHRRRTVPIDPRNLQRPPE